MLRLLLAFTIYACAFSLCGLAADLSVPDSYPGIQAAIDAGSPGDTVLVKPGTYTETLRLKDGVSLKGENRDKTIVQCAQSAGAPIKIQGVTSGRVEGLTFQHIALAESQATPEIMYPAIHIIESKITVADCIARNAACTGVSLQGGEPKLEKCLVENNTTTGIYCEDAKTRPEITGCVIRGNGDSGISFYWDDLHAVARDNLIQDNGRYGINFGNKAHVESTGNDYTRNSMISYQEIVRLSLTKEFAPLEAIVKRLRDEKTRFPSGEWQLPFFYEWLSDAGQFMEGESEVRFFKMIDAWKAAYPDSLTWRMVLCKAYQQRAWGYRGSGYSYTVTEEGWKGYHDYLDRAWKVLEECSKIEPKDPEYFQVRAELVMEAPPSSESSTTTLTGVIVRTLFSSLFSDPEKTPFVKGVAFEPLYYPLYYERTRALLPRWGGSREAMLAFAEKSADDTAKLAGDTLYAVIATKVKAWESNENFLAYGFSWPRIQKGYDRILQDFPDSWWRLSWYCWLACVYEDNAVAATLFKKIGDNWDIEVWDTEPRFTAYRKWALEGTAYPRPSKLELAIRDGNTYEVEGLLNSGADAKTTTIDGDSLALVAINKDEPGILSLL
ncbi:MAG: right-handed parallel beta-helix repeat-containing protein, partial [Candidatus Hydrogenedentes bacterium]|nr:right-handed parallel beta-helix repeat-containing protein [Candidatus Hydrogenedentota bacterium]